MPDSLVIGLTGGIASGKSTVARYLEQLGGYLIDADIIARDVVAPESPTNLAIRHLLGEGYLLADGHLNRPKIKHHIFNNLDIMAKYNAIIQPAIRQAILVALSSVSDEACYTLLVVPLLFEKGLDTYCDYTVVVDVSVAEQIRRGILRKPEDAKVIHQIIQAQMPREIRNAKADFIVDNNVETHKLYQSLDALHQHLIHLRPKG